MVGVLDRHSTDRLIANTNDADTFIWLCKIPEISAATLAHLLLVRYLINAKSETDGILTSAYLFCSPVNLTIKEICKTILLPIMFYHFDRDKFIRLKVVANKWVVSFITRNDWLPCARPIMEYKKNYYNFYYWKENIT